MMLAARGAIRASGAGLPYDAEVEYLESSGTQFLEIPLVVDNTATVNITGFVSATNKELFSFDKIGQKQFNIETGATYYRWWTTDKINLGSGYVGALHSYKCNSSLWVDGTLAGTITPTLSDSTQKFYILCGYHNAASGRVYSCSVEYNGVLVFDGIPVRKSTVGYLYDRVSGKLFGNAGGTLIKVGLIISEQEVNIFDDGVGLEENPFEKAFVLEEDEKLEVDDGPVVSQ